MSNPLAQLCQRIAERCALEEVQALYFALGIDWDELPGQTKSAKARELILHLGRHKHLDRLLTTLHQTRPDAFDPPDTIDLDPLYAALPSFEDSQLPLPPAPGDPPYKGMQYFDTADASLFFGREALTAQLVARLHSQRFLAVVGASGSGKSSVVRAGLIPALKNPTSLLDGTLPPEGSGRWPVHLITPTNRPPVHSQ